MIDHLQELVRHVGDRIVLPGCGRADVEVKPDGTEVTSADLAAHTHLLQELPRLRNAPVLSEEMTREEQERTWEAGRAGLWVIDPIDGTNNYCRGNPLYAVSVAFLEDYQPASGVIYAPALGEIYHAVPEGAFLNGQRMATSRCADLGRAVLSLGSQPSPAVQFRAIRQMGSGALELAWLAAGRFDLYLHRKNKLWDYAVGAWLVELAGGRIAGPQGEPLWQADVYEGQLLGAASADLHDAFAKALNALPR